MPRRPETEEDEKESFWRGLGRDLIVAAAIVVAFLLIIWAYTGIWPPLVVVESSSMQHGDRESFLGVIDTGDMVLQQAAPTRDSVITYIEGRATGYRTYGDFGDVIIFRRSASVTPIIHRAIMYIVLHDNGTADVSDIARLPEADWEATNETGATRDPYYLRFLTIRNMGYRQDLDIEFDFTSFLGAGRSEGYITMGDNNAYRQCALQTQPCRRGYDTGWLVRQTDIIGRARGELPWFGLLRLTLAPTPSCCTIWGDPEAPKNSWDALLLSLLGLIALPFAIEYARRGWTKYVSPRLPKIRRRRREERNDREPARSGKESEDPPREGSSGP